MKETDVGFIAEISGQKIGAIWTRLFNSDDRGYGFVNDNIPELSMAVKAEYRNKGIGKKLLNSVFSELIKQEYDGVSLSVDKNNKVAVNLYKIFGFVVLKEQNTDYVMVKYLR